MLVILEIMTLNEELFSIVHTRNVTGHDMYQKSSLHRGVYVSLHLENQPGNYHQPMRMKIILYNITLNL